MYCSMVSAIAFTSSSSEYSWSESKLKSGDLNLSRLSDLKCLLDDRNSLSGFALKIEKILARKSNKKTKISVSVPDDRYAVSNRSGYAVTLQFKQEKPAQGDHFTNRISNGYDGAGYRRHFKSLSLDELRSPDFNLLSDQEYSEEEEAEAMVETMEQYMSKTRTDYGSRVVRPKIDNKDQFELKGQFFKELQCPQHYLTEMQEVILFYNGLDVPTRQILDLIGAIPTKTAEDAKKAIQEMAKYSQKWHNGTSRGRSIETSNGLAAIQAQLNNLGREIKKVNEKIIITVKKKKRGSMDQNSQKLMELHISITPYPERRKTQGVSLYLALLIILALIMPFLRERMELDLEARLMGETLVLNRSLDPFLEDYIELNDLNKPFELRRNQGDDLMPTIEEGEFHNSIMKDKMVDRGDNVVRALMNVPIFVGTFSVVTDFVVLEDMDAYHDEGMGDVIVGEPFLREVGIKTRRFDGIITLYKSDDEVNEKDEKNGISYAYQKLKGFYKGVLNLGPDYILNAKTEEWLTRGHISVHEM
ncbi:hypothetical protein Tco_1409461 [Tanacetum coccineum]